MNKIKIDNKNNLIRYTVQDLKHKEWKKQEHNFHSQQVTEIEIIKETKSNSSKVSTLEMWAEEVVASDEKLSVLLKAVNNVSKIVDENGEPLAELLDFKKIVIE